MQFSNSTKSVNPVVSTGIYAFRLFAFFTIVVLSNATLSAQVFEVTDLHAISRCSEIFEAREVGTNRALAVKVRLSQRENADEDLAIENRKLVAIEEKVSAVPEERRHLVLRARNYAKLQENVKLLDGLTAGKAIVFPLFKEDLRTLLLNARINASNYPITEASILSISRDILYGLKLLHQTAGYVHGNLKPSEIMLRRTAFEISASIADFRQASLINEATVGFFKLKGYTPPEHFNNGQPVQRTAAFDVFSFGSVLYQLATGKQIYIEALVTLQRRSWTMPEKVALHLRESMRSIIIRCWNQDPHERPTIDQILKALDVYAGEIGFPWNTNYLQETN